MTPLVGLIAGVLTYYLIRNKYSSLIYLLFILTAFIIALNLLFINPKVYGPIRFSSVMYVVTHARSMIWVQQLEILVKTYTLKDYFFGNFTSELFSVKAYQLGGFEKNVYYDNPHNTYLLLFFKAPLLFIIYYMKYLNLIFKQYNRRTFVIISFIGIACLSNSSLISLGNPVYLIILAFLLTHQEFKINTSLV